jgi:tetratricopeptide (TPR) repeat protein
MKSERSLAVFIVSFFVAALAVADLWAAFTPTGLNWGFHFLAFYGKGIRFTVPLLMLLCIVPAVQTSIISLVEKAAGQFSRRSRLTRIALIVLFLVGLGSLFWHFREQTYLLGDGQLCLRSVRQVGTLEQLVSGYGREPLVGFFVVLLSNFFMLLKTPLPCEEAYRWLSILSGIVFTAVAWRFVKYLSTDRIEELLLWVLLIASGAAQLFFGYVENYPPACAAIFLFLLLGVAYARKAISIAWPAVAYIVVLLLHLGSLVFVPALLFLGFVSLRRKEYAELGATVFLALAVLLVLLGVSGYTPEHLYAIFKGTRHFLLPLSLPVNKLQAYTFFTWNHLVDILNFLLLCSPAGMIVLVGAAILYRKKRQTIAPETWFLLLAAACGLAFIVVLNCELGMSRDWDILAPFASTLVVAATAAWSAVAEEKTLRYNVLVMLGAVSLLHTAAWIGVNADERRALERYGIIQNRQLWSVHAMADASEELAIYYREHDQLEKVPEFYMKYIAIDSTNARIWKNLAEIQEMVGDTQKAIQTYETIMRLEMDDPYVLTNLAMLYGHRQRFSEAYDLLIRAEEGDPCSPLIENNIGVTIIKGEGDHRKALPYFLRAIQYDSTYATAYFNVALCYAREGDTAAANRYLSRLQQPSPLPQDTPAERKGKAELYSPP